MYLINLVRSFQFFSSSFSHQGQCHFLKANVFYTHSKQEESLIKLIIVGKKGLLYIEVSIKF